MTTLPICTDLPVISFKNLRRLSQECGYPFWVKARKNKSSDFMTTLKPDEICPVLPSPSVNPRRADDLIAEYRAILFDRLRVEPQNIIYASEWNPFEVYRQIYRTMERYNSALQALDKCKIVVSALLSKLLSVGALLAACEGKRNGLMVGISHVETHGYRIQKQLAASDAELFTLWIAGECYNA